MTVEFLFRAVVSPATNNIVGVGGTGETEANNHVWVVNLQSGNIWRWTQEFGAGSNAVFTSSVDMVIDATYHLAFTRTSDVIKVYVNGRLADTSSAITTATGGSTSPFRVGRDINDAGTFRGTIASLKVINSALSDAQVLAEYNRTLGAVFERTTERSTAVPLIGRHDTTYSPVGLWQLDGDLTDSSGNGRDLSLEGGTTRWTHLAPDLRGFFFDGATRLSRSATDAALQLTGDLTFEALVTFDRHDSESQAIMSWHDLGETEATNTLYSFRTVGVGNSLEWVSESGAGVNATYTATTGVDRGIIHHVAVVRESDVLKFYLNGELYETSGSLTTPTGGSSGRFALGGFYNFAGNEHFGGIASAKLIDRALTAAEVISEYNRTVGAAFPRAA
jgi:hypothetical protein